MRGSVAVGSDRGQREMFPWTVLSVHQLDTQIYRPPDHALLRLRRAVG